MNDAIKMKYKLISISTIKHNTVLDWIKENFKQYKSLFYISISKRNDKAHITILTDEEIEDSFLNKKDIDYLTTQEIEQSNLYHVMNYLFRH